MQIVDVPGVGEVEFPDEMGDAEIVAAVQRLSGAPSTTTKSAPVDASGFHPERILPWLGDMATGAARGVTQSWFGAPPGVRPDEVAEVEKRYQEAQNPQAAKFGEFVGGAATPEGAVIGEVGGTVLRSALKAAAPHVRSGLRSLAERAAVRSTNADRTALRRALHGSTPARQDLGRFMLDEKVPLRSPKSIRDAAQGISREAGDEIGRLTQAADQAGAKVDLAAAVNAAKQNKAVAGLAKNTVGRKSHEQIVEMLDDQLAQHGGQVSPSVAHDIRMQLDQLANWEQAAPKPVQAAWRAARSEVDSALDAGMQGAGMADDWTKANARFAQSRKLTNPKKRGLADIGVERREGNRLGSPSEKGAALLGAMSAGMGDPVAGVAIPAATVALNRSFFPVSARTLDALSRVPVSSAAKPATRAASPTILDLLRGLGLRPAEVLAEEEETRR